MRSLLITLFVIFVSGTLFISGCGSSQPALPDAQSEAIPSWFLTPPQDPNYIFAPATMSSRDLQTAINRATQAARAEVGRVVEVHLEGMQKSFTEEVGVGDDATFRQMFEEVSRTVVATSLSGSQVKEQAIERDGNLFRAYVLVEYPIGAANQQFLDQIKEQEEMYTRFRSAQSFQELERQVERYE